MNAKEAIEELDSLLPDLGDRELIRAGKQALSVLSALAESTQFAAYEDVRGRLVDALKERDALKAEVERLKESSSALIKRWREIAEKAEAELTAMRSEADAARPLLEAVEHEPLYDYPIGGIDFESIGKISREALAYRARVKGEKE